MGRYFKQHLARLAGPNFQPLHHVRVPPGGTLRWHATTFQCTTCGLGYWLPHDADTSDIPPTCSHCGSSAIRPRRYRDPASCQICASNCHVAITLPEPGEHRTSYGNTLASTITRVCLACWHQCVPLANQHQGFRCANCGWLPNEFMVEQDGHYVCRHCCDFDGGRLSGIVILAPTQASITCRCGNHGILAHYASPDQGVCPVCLYTPYNRERYLTTLGDAHPLLPAGQVQGVEIECLIGHWDHVIAEHAIIKQDGSLRATHGGIPVEFAVQPASGAALAARIAAVGQALQNMQAYTNSSCGLHVHESVRHYPTSQLTNLRGWWRVYEPLFECCVHPWRRGARFNMRVGSASEVEWQGQRYSSLNLQAYHAHGTYEVRLPEGSVDPEYITFWLSLLGHFFARMPGHNITDEELQFLATAHDRAILRHFVQQLELPRPTVRWLLAALREFAPEAAFLSRETPYLIPTPPEDDPPNLASEEEEDDGCDVEDTDPDYQDRLNEILDAPQPVEPAEVTAAPRPMPF